MTHTHHAAACAPHTRPLGGSPYSPLTATAAAAASRRRAHTPFALAPASAAAATRRAAARHSARCSDSDAATPSVVSSVNTTM
jgi:hypothetical protein